MKSMKNKILFFLLLLGSVFLTACSDEDNPTQSEIKIITTEEQLILDSKTNARITLPVHMIGKRLQMLLGL